MPLREIIYNFKHYYKKNKYDKSPNKIDLNFDEKNSNFKSPYVCKNVQLIPSRYKVFPSIKSCLIFIRPVAFRALYILKNGALRPIVQTATAGV